MSRLTVYLSVVATLCIFLGVIFFAFCAYFVAHGDKSIDPVRGIVTGLSFLTAGLGVSFWAVMSRIDDMDE